MGKWDAFPNRPGVDARRAELTPPACQLKGCGQPVTVPKRGKVPAYCSEAHRKAAFRALKKELEP